MNFPREHFTQVLPYTVYFVFSVNLVNILHIRDKKIFSVYFGGKGKRRIDSLCPKSSSVSQPSEICGGFTMSNTGGRTKGESGYKEGDS